MTKLTFNNKQQKKTASSRSYSISVQLTGESKHLAENSNNNNVIK
ncbi:hypothetical protein DOY81_013335 [Sarcophaga bullata]|nr:hypothetical protein DOY81_013335 [Sarcophaga bullata]